MLEITPQERIAAASILNLHEQYLYQVLSGRRKAPVERCPDFERALGGRVSCETLRPDVAWHRMPDPTWSWHPEGRPLIDCTRPVANQAQEGRDAA